MKWKRKCDGYQINSTITKWCNCTIVYKCRRHSIKFLLNIDINTLEHRRIEQSLTIFYKCYQENGPSYLADLFEPRMTPYNLRNTGLNVTQNSYNSKFRHNSYSFVISRIWNKLPFSVKTAPILLSFRRKLKTLIFTGCQCKRCL